jgi:cellulose synthase/poly-beta-1,6-N-acetylglucosamine synthase-like glycosyltransferase
MAWLGTVGYAIAIVAALPCAYLFGLAVLAIIGRISRKPLPRPGDAVGERGQGHVAFVVPAHNEEADIEETLRGLITTVDDNASIHIVAGNCSDKTADIVRAFVQEHEKTAGARVIKLWERHHETLRSKGYALEWALPQIFSWSDGSVHAADFVAANKDSKLGPARFICIIDADALLSEGSLALARRKLAEGQDVVQSSYLFGKGLGVRNEVMRIASAAIIVRGLGRAAVGLSDTLKGNGMFFRRDVLEQIPWCAYSLAEDLEYTMLLIKHGKRVHVMDGSTVSGKMSATKKGETDQRLRWEGGRLDVVRKEVPALLRQLFSKPSLQTFDILVELLIPPLGLLVGLQVAALIVTLLLPGEAYVILIAAWALLTSYVVVSVPLAGLPLKTFLALAYVPVYVAWKIALIPRTFIASRSKRWIRTAR